MTTRTRMAAEKAQSSAAKGQTETAVVSGTFNTPSKRKEVDVNFVKNVMSSIAQKLYSFSAKVKFSSPIALKHLVFAFLLRVASIIGAELIDNYFQVQYTDVDYTVFTDAARHVYEGSSPYERQTFRYSPLLAYLNLPNIYFHDSFGKFLFTLSDLAVAFSVYEIAVRFSTPKLANISSLIWLYNPVSIVISTRGNADTVICVLVLLTLYFRLKNKVVLTGLLLALGTHLRMYPLLYSLPIFLSLRNVKDRVKLVLSAVLTFSALTGGFYYLYGDRFITEAYLYHFIRKDIKHNYSVYFLSQYLNFSDSTHFLSQYVTLSAPLLKFAPLLILQTVCATRLYNINDLPFCLFLQTFLFVTFSSVITCQYFVWYLSLLIPILPQFINIKQIIARFFVWAIVVLLWLVPAYYLEFQGVNLFVYVELMSALFFLVNINIVINLVKLYKPLKKTV